MAKLTQKDHEDLDKVIRDAQRVAGSALVVLMKEAGAQEHVVHTEINPVEKIFDGRYLVSTLVRPLTSELLEEIKQGKHF